MSLGYLISMMGLIVDIAGGCLLAWSVIGRNPQRVFVEATPFLGFNRYLFESGILASVEAKFAVPLLVIGFIGQFTGNYLETVSSTSVSLETQLGGIVLAVLLVLITITICLLRKMWWSKRMDAYFEIIFCIWDFKPDVPVDKSVIETARLETGLVQETNEIDIEYVKRCLKHIQQRLHIREVKSSREKFKK